MARYVETHIACNLCGGRRASVIATRSRSGAPLRSVACTGCGLSWSDPRPIEARPFYEREYRVVSKGTRVPRPWHVLRAGRVALWRLERVRPYLAAQMRVLDVGSGGGEFAYLLQGRGHVVTGVEPDVGYGGFSRLAYGLDVRKGMLHEVPLEPAAYDLITIWHVLEHTEDPFAVLTQLRAALKPGGTLVIEVPNIEATCQAPASTFHEDHLYNFNAATLEALAARAGLARTDASVSADGGNIMLACRLAPGAVPTLDPERLRANHDRVFATVARRRRLGYYASPHPYARAVRRLTQRIGERLATRGAFGPRALLDRLYAEAAAPAPPRPRGRLSRWTIPVYGAALALEWLLLDGTPPFGERASLGLYFVIQTCVVLAAAATFRTEGRSWREYTRLGAWSVPLFALPAFC